MSLSLPILLPGPNVQPKVRVECAGAMLLSVSSLLLSETGTMDCAGDIDICCGSYGTTRQRDRELPLQCTTLHSESCRNYTSGFSIVAVVLYVCMESPIAGGGGRADAVVVTNLCCCCCDTTGNAVFRLL